MARLVASLLCLALGCSGSSEARPPGGGDGDAAPGTDPGADARTGGGDRGTTPLFRSDCNLADCGFPQNWGQFEGVLYDTTIVEGGCPDGTPSARIAYRSVAYDPGMVQHPIGFGLQGIATTPVQGMELYVRWRARVLNQFPGGANELGWSGKFIMIGDPGPETSRLIANLRDNGTTAESTAYDWSRNIDGAEHGTGVHEVPPGQWHAGQLYVRTSTTATSQDASLKIWLDADNGSEATPSGASPETFAVDVSSWAGTNTRFGGFVGLARNPIESPAPIIEICGFELDDAFDPRWHEP